MLHYELQYRLGLPVQEAGFFLLPYSRQIALRNNATKYLGRISLLNIQSFSAS